MIIQNSSYLIVLIIVYSYLIDINNGANIKKLSDPIKKKASELANKWNDFKIKYSEKRQKI